MAPSSMEISAPMITPIVVKAPMTAPFSPYIIFPPEIAIKSGSRYVSTGVIKAFSISFDSQIPNAVRIPQPINAPRFGSTMALSFPPKRWAFTRKDTSFDMFNSPLLYN